MNPTDITVVSDFLPIVKEVSRLLLVAPGSFQLLRSYSAIH